MSPEKQLEYLEVVRERLLHSDRPEDWNLLECVAYDIEQVEKKINEHG